MPPITPEPSHISQSWCVWTPTAPISRPPHQQRAATTPALRGPTRSSQPPQMAAAEPRITKNRVNIQSRLLIFQSQLDANSSPKSDMSAGHAFDLLMPIERDSGIQNTLKP